jgi:hypothetical protein
LRAVSSKKNASEARIAPQVSPDSISFVRTAALLLRDFPAQASSATDCLSDAAYNLISDFEFKQTTRSLNLN